MRDDLISLRNELQKAVDAQGALILGRPIQDFAEFKHLLGIYYGLSRATELVNQRIQAKQDPTYDYTSD